MKIFNIIFFLFILITSAKAQCWQLDTVWNTSHFLSMYDMQMLSNGDALMAGEIFITFGENRDTTGAIFKTVDGGRTWQKKADDLRFPRVNKMDFPTDNVGYAVGNRACLLKTTDGGETWESLDNPYLVKLEIDDLHFFSEDHGILLPKSVNFNESLLYETYDGGETWEIRNYTWDELAPFRMFFVNDSIGFTTTGSSIENRIFKTTDGGKTWQPKFYNAISPHSFFGIYFIDTLNGWVGSNTNYIYHTTDGGETWESQLVRDFSSNIPNGGISKIFFENDQKGWATGYRKMIMTTDNGGIHWRYLNSQFEPEPVLGIIISPQNELWLATGSKEKGGRILKCDLNQPPPNCLNGAPTLINENPDSTSNFPTFSWSHLDTGCFDGYYLNIGTSPGELDILAYQSTGNDTFFSIAKSLPYESTLYATAVPYNCAKVAEGCSSVEFTTGKCPEIEVFIDTTLHQGDTFLSNILVNDTLITEVIRTPLNCDSTVNYLISVKPVSTKDIKNPLNSLRVYPNPAKDIIHFELTTKEIILKAKIIDQNGREIARNTPINSFKGILSVNNLQAGVYYLQIITTHHSIAKKIMISN